MKTQYSNRSVWFYAKESIYVLIVFILLLPAFRSNAQCPPNIDFEKGNFSNWECWSGEVIATDVNEMRWYIGSPGGPANGRHTMLTANPGDGIDKYGLFPVNCPNGSGHSIRLGNDGGGHQGEAVSYTFTIPPGQNDFSLYFNYAVVLQNPGHSERQQPRFVVTVENLTDSVNVPCQLAPFVSGGGLPGFQVSRLSTPGAIIMYKDWAAASINLDGYAGKTIRVFFRTSDCTFQAHFGYAYLDIESDCSSKISGTVYCPKDPFLDLKAPPGFQFYRWFNTSNITLGNEQSIRLNPLPQNGDTVFVELIPYNGYGCTDTLVGFFNDGLQVQANAGVDRQFCVHDTLQLGEAPKAGLVYKWFPETGLSDPNIANPYVIPTSEIQYTLTVTSPGGGCIATDEIRLFKKCGTINFFVPAAFTPNGDGLNDRLAPVLYGISKVNFKIFNRYGQLLYNTNTISAGWDGTIRGKPASTQTVVWMIETVDAYGRIEKRQGTSILIR